MSNSSLQDAISAYRTAIKDLEEQHADHLILAVLVARDKVKDAFYHAEEELDIASINECSFEIMWLDKYLKNMASRERWPYKVDGWRNSLGKSDSDWWWRSSGLQSRQRSKRDAFLNIASFVLLVFTVGSVVNTSSKLLTLNIVWLGGSAIVLQGFFVYLASKTTLTTSSQWLDHLFTSFRIPSKRKSFAKLLLVFTALGISLFVEFTCLSFSQHYTQQGLEYYLNEDYIIAKNRLENAIKLDSSNVEAINWLGEVYELMAVYNPKFTQLAEEQYVKAVEMGSLSALNNLARRDITEEYLGKDKSEENKSEQDRTLITRLGNEDYLREDGTRDISHAVLQHDFYLNSGWFELNTFRVNSSQEELQMKLQKSLGELMKAIKIMEEWTNGNDNSKNIRYFLRHANAYCLRAEVSKEMMNLEISSQQIEIYKNMAKNDYHQCKGHLERKKTNRPYEVLWLNNDAEKVRES
jgi:hypothetical protein